MARKRARSGDDAEQNDAASEQQGQPSARPGAQRREEFADIARRRAAHFANFNDEAEDDGGVHVGSNQARSLGPWSSAVELVNARQAAVEQRNRQLQQAANEAGDDIEWAPARDPALGPRRSCPVRSLFGIALDLLTQHIQAVSSLWGVPDSIRSQLAAAVCACGKMTPETAQLFGQDLTTELVLPNCTQLDPTAMLQLLALLVTGVSNDEGSADDAQKVVDQQQALRAATLEAATAKEMTTVLAAFQQAQQQQCRLERLELGNCGRGFTDAAAAALAAVGPLQQLSVLRLGGAYKLGDSGLLRLLEACPNLKELAVPDASRLTGALLSKLPSVAPQLSVLDLKNCRGLPGDAIAALLGQMVALQRLTLSGIPEVDAGVLAAAGRCRSLRALSLVMCPGVNDDGLMALAAATPRATAQAAGQFSPGLEELYLDECTAITNAGLSAIAAGCRNLRILTVRRCIHLTDESLTAVADRGVLEVLSVNGVHHVTSALIQALMRNCKDTLRELDVSFCRDVAESALGKLVDQCVHLKSLRVYGCTQLTKKFMYGHSNETISEMHGAVVV